MTNKLMSTLEIQMKHAVSEIETGLERQELMPITIKVGTMVRCFYEPLLPYVQKRHVSLQSYPVS